MWWGGVVDAVDLARRFGLGGAARLSAGPVARGKQGLVWRLDTADGSWAVKVPLHQSDEDQVRSATAFQEAAYAAGVPTPQVRRTTEGCVLATLGGSQVRVYEWVDLRAPDAGLEGSGRRYRRGAVTPCRRRHRGGTARGESRGDHRGGGNHPGSVAHANPPRVGGMHPKRTKRDSGWPKRFLIAA